MSRTRMPIRHAIASLFWRCSRYRPVRENPPFEGARVLVGAPHTSNWDFVLMLGLAWDARMSPYWLGKAELFKGWRGPIMRALGGIPVDRKNPARVVDEVVALLARDPDASIVVTPDGTRTNTGHWRSGFYRIARGAGIPLTLGWADSTTKTAGLGPTFMPTGDVGADMDRIRAFYADKAGVKPQYRAEPRLRDEASGAGL